MLLINELLCIFLFSQNLDFTAKSLPALFTALFLTSFVFVVEKTADPSCKKYVLSATLMGSLITDLVNPQNFIPSSTAGSIARFHILRDWGDSGHPQTREENGGFIESACSKRSEASPKLFQVTSCKTRIIL